MHSSDPDETQGRYVVIGMLVGLALLTAGALAYVFLSDAPQAEPNKPRVVVLPMREPEEPLPKVSEPDLGPEDVGAPQTGCGKPAPHVRRATMHMPGRKITVYVPTGYDPSTPTPLVLLFHDDHQTANGFFWDTGFEEVAEEHNVLLALPRDQDLLNWRDLDDIFVGQQALDFVDSILCVDKERIYAIGNGSGGDLVERLACEIPIRAMATTAYRSGPDIACPDTKIPYLHVANLQDGYMPPDGDGCAGEVPTLEQHEAAWRKKNGCEGTRRSYFRRGPHQCWSYTCDTTFVSCHLDAGKGWPLLDNKRALDIFNCDGDPPKDFPLAAVIWRFFASHGP